MGYMWALSECYTCGHLFHYNPELVPSHRDADGIRQPICRACIDRANPIRERIGLEPIVPLPGAYDPQEGW